MCVYLSVYLNICFTVWEAFAILTLKHDHKSTSLPLYIFCGPEGSGDYAEVISAFQNLDPENSLDGRQLSDDAVSKNSTFMNDRYL